MSIVIPAQKVKERLEEPNSYCTFFIAELFVKREERERREYLEPDWLFCVFRGLRVEKCTEEKYGISFQGFGREIP